MSAKLFASLLFLLLLFGGNRALGVTHIAACVCASIIQQQRQKDERLTQLRDHLASQKAVQTTLEAKVANAERDVKTQKQRLAALADAHQQQVAQQNTQHTAQVDKLAVMLAKKLEQAAVEQDLAVKQAEREASARLQLEVKRKEKALKDKMNTEMVCTRTVKHRVRGFNRGLDVRRLFTRTSNARLRRYTTHTHTQT